VWLRHLRAVSCVAPYDESAASYAACYLPFHLKAVRAAVRLAVRAAEPQRPRLFTWTGNAKANVTNPRSENVLRREISRREKLRLTDFARPSADHLA
jgi:hypothetical protein